MLGHLRTSTEIAHRFSRKRDDATLRIARRLENWGNIGLLTPVGERHTGRGRARAYDEYEQVKAAVLLLSFTYQTPKAVLEIVSRLFDDVRRFREGVALKGVRAPSKRSNTRLQELSDLMDVAFSGKRDVYLILYPTELEDAPEATFGKSLDALKKHDSAAVVNITRAVKRVN